MLTSAVLKWDGLDAILMQVFVMVLGKACFFSWAAWLAESEVFSPYFLFSSFLTSISLGFSSLLLPDSYTKL